MTRPSTAFDVVPFVNVCALVLFFGLLGSRFVLAPGMAIRLELPTTQGVAPDALSTSRVLSLSQVDGSEMLIFEGRILKLTSFERFLQDRPGAYVGEVLLVRMDRDVPTGMMARVLDLAKRGGFADVLIAVEPELAAAPATIR